MTIRQIYRDDILGRFSGHSFVETVIGSTTRVELQDAESNTILMATTVDVDDAYAIIRGNMVALAGVLPRLTEDQRDALAGTIEGTTIFNTNAQSPETLQSGSWAPTNQLIYGDPTFLGSVKVGGDTAVAPSGAIDAVGTNVPTSRIRAVRYQDLPTAASVVQVGHSRGTEQSPDALLSGDRLGRFVWVGCNGLIGFSPGPFVQGETTEAWGGSAKGSRLTLHTIPNGTTAAAVALTISEHGYPEHPTYTVSTLPPVGDGGGTIFISDETGGATMAFSDGTDWRRVQDRAIVA